MNTNDKRRFIGLILGICFLMTVVLPFDVFPSATVEAAENAISVSKDSIALGINETQTVTVTAQNPQDLIFSISDSDVASFSSTSSGNKVKLKITGKKNGFSRIVVTSDGDRSAQKVIKVSVGDVGIESLTNSSKNSAMKEVIGDITLTKGGSYKLRIIDSHKKVKWRSSDNSVVKVTNKGTIKGVGEGNAVVTADVDGVVEKWEVNVIDVSLSVKGSKKISVGIGETYSVKIVAKGSHSVNFTVSDSSIASAKWGNSGFDNDTVQLNIKGKKNGKCTVKVFMSKHQDVYVTLNITVGTGISVPELPNPVDYGFTETAHSTMDHEYRVFTSSKSRASSYGTAWLNPIRHAGFTVSRSDFTYLDGDTTYIVYYKHEPLYIIMLYTNGLDDYDAWFEFCGYSTY